jgi:autotransporter adhesin
VAAGLLSATSTDAVNGSQLYAVASAASKIGSSVAAALGGGATMGADGTISAPAYTVGGTTYNNVGGAVTALQTSSPLQYSTSAAPTTPQGYLASQDVTLAGASAGPVRLHNVAAGTAPTDAANVSQLPGAFTSPSSNTFAFAQSGNGGAPVTLQNVAAGAVTANSTQAVNGAQLYSVSQASANGVNNLAQMLNASTQNLQNQINGVDQRAAGGTALALAASGLRYDDRPGKITIAAATGIYRDQAGFAGGAGYTSRDGHWRLNAAASFNPASAHSDVGAVAGASFSFP